MGSVGTTDGLTERATVEDERAYSKLLELLLEQRLEPMLDHALTRVEQRLDGNFIRLDSRVIDVESRLTPLVARFNGWNTQHIDMLLERLVNRIETLERALGPEKMAELEAEGKPF